MVQNWTDRASAPPAGGPADAAGGAAARARRRWARPDRPGAALGAGGARRRCSSRPTRPNACDMAAVRPAMVQPAGPRPAAQRARACAPRRRGVERLPARRGATRLASRPTGAGADGLQPGRDDGAACRAARRGTRPAAILAYSGALLGGRDAGGRRSRARPPVLLVHGEADAVVPACGRPRRGRRAAGSGGVPVEALFRPGLDHGIDEVGLAAGARCCSACLAPRADGAAGDHAPMTMHDAALKRHRGQRLLRCAGAGWHEAVADARPTCHHGAYSRDGATDLGPYRRVGAPRV